jgi:hypothetical protein
MADIVLKGEIHTSRGDLEREKELLKEGFDILLLEQSSSQEEQRYSILDSWFSIANKLFFFILSYIYTSHQILKDIADIKGTEIIYTRESEKDILENNTLKTRTLCSGLFYLLLTLSFIYVYEFGDWFGGAIMFLAAIGTPLVLLRFGEMRSKNNSENRDKIMADKILSAHKEGKSVLAVVGESHIERIQNHLPDDLDVRVEGAEYGKASINHLKDIGLPVFTAFSVAYMIYLLVRWLSTQIITLV